MRSGCQQDEHGYGEVCLIRCTDLYSRCNIHMKRYDTARHSGGHLAFNRYLRTEVRVASLSRQCVPPAWRSLFLPIMRTTPAKSAGAGLKTQKRVSSGWKSKTAIPLLLPAIPYRSKLTSSSSVFGTIYPLFSREKEDHVVNSFKIWWHFSCFPRKN